MGDPAEEGGGGWKGKGDRVMRVMIRMLSITKPKIVYEGKWSRVRAIEVMKEVSRTYAYIVQGMIDPPHLAIGLVTAKGVPVALQNYSTRGMIGNLPIYANDAGAQEKFRELFGDVPPEKVVRPRKAKGD